MKQNPFFCLLIILLSSHAFAVTNGQETTEETFAAVKKLRLAGGGDCTGTFVGPHTMVTAAHCVRQSFGLGLEGTSVPLPADLRSGGRTHGVLDIEIKLGKVSARPVAYRMHPKYAEGAANKKGYDIAILEFSSHIHATHADFSNAPAKAEQPIALVGYGLPDTTTPKAPAKKRYGKNVIKQVFPDMNQILITGEKNDTQKATPLPGDSGGPLLNAQNEVIGTAGMTNGLATMTPVGTYVDVNAPEIRDFLIKAVKELETNVPSLHPSRQMAPASAPYAERLEVPVAAGAK